jgi:transcriptional regulator with XRE-family HTH domain
MSIGLTQRELADAAGMSIGALRDLEQGRTRCPRWGAVAAFAAALDMDRNQRAELASAWSGGQPMGVQDMARWRGRPPGQAGPACGSAC